MANEKRLIDANGLVNRIDNPKCRIWFSRKVSDSAANWARFLVNDSHTVDAVEVVRCKDCRWARPQDHREPTETPKGCLICQCFMHHHIPAPWGARLAVNPDDFCSKGERRNDG